MACMSELYPVGQTFWPATLLGTQDLLLVMDSLLCLNIELPLFLNLSFTFLLPEPINSPLSKCFLLHDVLR